MRTNKTLKWIVVLSIILPLAPLSAVEVLTLKTQKEQESYAIGADLVKSLKRQGVEVQSDALIKGMQDALSGQKMLMTEDQIRETLAAYQNEIKKKRIQARGGTGVILEENRDKEIAFLAANKSKEGVISLPSGLQYKILKAGNGPKPTATNSISCNFRGTFIDGTEFNSSQRAGKPVTFKKNDVVAGWKEIWSVIPTGSKFMLFVPSQLAFGEKGVPGAKGRFQIPPNAMVIFEIELLGIN